MSTLEYRFDGVGSWQSLSSFGTINNLFAGSYSIEFRDPDSNDSQCYVTLDVDVPSSNTPPTVVAFTDINPSNCAATNGRIIFGLEGNDPPGVTIETRILELSTNWQEQDTYGGLAPGQYTLEIRIITPNGDIGCPGSLVYDLEPNSNGLGLFVDSETPATCGIPDGSVTLATSVGGNLEYSLDESSWQGSSTFNTLPGGQQLTFYVRSTDNASCEESITYTLGENPLPTPGFGVFPPSTCNTSDGTITVDPPTPEGSYNYELVGEGISSQDGVFDNVGIGTYDIYIEDQNNSGCNTTITNVPVTADGINADIITDDESVCGENDGSITVDVTQGGPFEFQVIGQPGGFQPTGTSYGGLAADNYDIEIRATDGSCSDILSTTIFEGPPVEITYSADPESYCGQEDGALDITILTSTSNDYDYVLVGSNGPVTQGFSFFSDLAPEVYDIYVELSDGSCPSDVINAGVPEGDLFDITTTVDEPSTCGGNDGSIQVTFPTDGQYGYRRSINSVYSSDPLLDGLSAAVYNVQVAFIGDPQFPRCETSDLVTVPDGPSFTINTTPTNPTSCGGSDGRIEVSTNAPSNIDLRYRLVGVPGYRISGVFDSLPANTYTVEVSQFDGSCVSIETVTLTQPTSIDFSATPSPTIFCGQNSGTIVVDPIPGGPYEYNIDQGNFQTSRTFQNLLAGDY
ncbi:MAG: hypothetical protein AAFU67_10690, partial [Bacteroidota bacterium]